METVRPVAMAPVRPVVLRPVATVRAVAMVRAVAAARPGERTRRWRRLGQPASSRFVCDISSKGADHQYRSDGAGHRHRP
ncbi:hypothetical protein ACFY3B_22035 [Micromonospora parva]|uniref:Uncharacterized protein n=1 Tax=Micromonospora parva TaxID=1464048 RepID=A0ABW6VZF6_9ACTN